MNKKDNVYKIFGCISSISPLRTKDGGIYAYKGVCKFPEGMVLVEQFRQYKKKFTYLHMSFIFNGNEYTRIINGKVFSKIGVARKAGEFVREITKNNE